MNGERSLPNEQIQLELEEEEGYDWKELDEDEQKLVYAAFAAAQKVWSSNQCINVKHDGQKDTGSGHCGGNIFAFFDNQNNVTYKCQSCGYTWNQQML